MDGRASIEKTTMPYTVETCDNNISNKYQVPFNIMFFIICFNTPVYLNFSLTLERLHMIKFDTESYHI